MSLQDARMRLAKAVTLSYEGKNADVTAQIRDARRMLESGDTPVAVRQRLGRAELQVDRDDVKARRLLRSAMDDLDDKLDVVTDGGFGCNHAIERRGPGNAVCRHCGRDASEVVHR